MASSPLSSDQDARYIITATLPSSLHLRPGNLPRQRSVPDPNPQTSATSAASAEAGARAPLSSQLLEAKPLLLANNWLTTGQYEGLQLRAMNIANVTPLAGRSVLAQYLVDQHALSREQANELDTINQVQKSMPDFQLLRKLGSGGMGTVFLARHLASNETVALKTINARLAQEEDFVSRFNREARSLLKINHPNVAKIIASGDSKDGHCWLAMEYIEGPSLMHLLRDHRVLPESYAVMLAKQVADGLGHVWKTSALVHRDIKPENILVLRSRTGDELFPLSDSAKVIDFGLVKSNQEDERLTQTGMTIGTPLYMSPEQVRGEKLDCRSDIYGLGATLYHLLTGATPFTGSSPGSIMSAHLTHPVPDAGDKVPSLSAATRDLVKTCMAKAAKDRFLTFEAVSQACQEAIDELTRRGHTGPRLLRKPMVLKNPVRRSGEIRLDAEQQAKLQDVPSPGPIPASATAQAKGGTTRTSGTGPVSPVPPVGTRSTARQRTPSPDTTRASRPPTPGATGSVVMSPSATPPGTTAGRPGTSVVPNSVARHDTTSVHLPPSRIDMTNSAAFSEPPPSTGIGLTPWLVLGGAIIALLAYLFVF